MTLRLLPAGRAAMGLAPRDGKHRRLPETGRNPPKRGLGGGTLSLLPPGRNLAA